MQNRERQREKKRERKRERERVNEQNIVAVSISSGFNNFVHPIISPHENAQSTQTHLHMKMAELSENVISFTMKYLIRLTNEMPPDQSHHYGKKVVVGTAVHKHSFIH